MKDVMYVYKLKKELMIEFEENGSYQLHTRLLFEPPQLDRKTLLHRYNANNALLDKLEKKIALSLTEQEDLYQLSSSYMLCYLNLIHEAKEQLQRARPLLKNQGNAVYETYKETQRILRKIKYN